METTDKKIRELNSDIDRLLKSIKTKLYNPKNTDWSHVGSTEHVRELLNEIDGFLG